MSSVDPNQEGGVAAFRRTWGRDVDDRMAKRRMSQMSQSKKCGVPATIMILAAEY